MLDTFVFYAFEFFTVLAYVSACLSVCLLVFGFTLAVAEMKTKPQLSENKFIGMDLETIFYLRFPDLNEQYDELTFNQAVARAKMLNASKKRKSMPISEDKNFNAWVACARVLYGEKVNFMVVRENELETLRRVLCIDDTDRIVLI